MFKMIDTDNSGQITLEELKNGLERVGAILKDSEISGLMQAVSTILICTLRVFSIMQAVITILICTLRVFSILNPSPPKGVYRL